MPPAQAGRSTAMKMSCFLVALLLTIAIGSRPSLGASESNSVPAGASGLGRELRDLIAKAGSLISFAGRAGTDDWHSAAPTEVDASARLRRRGTAGGKRLKKASVNCIPADLCRRKKVLCGKRCYRSRSGAPLNHVPSNHCVVRCKKCVPTC